VGSIPTASTMFPRWNRLSPFSGALNRGRLLACCGVCGRVLAIWHLDGDADGFTPLGPDFTPKTTFPASLSLVDADLSNPSASREFSRFVCFAAGPVPRGLPGWGVELDARDLAEEYGGGVRYSRLGGVRVPVGLGQLAARPPERQGRCVLP